MSDQIAIPVDVPLPEIERKKSLGQALVIEAAEGVRP